MILKGCIEARSQKPLKTIPKITGALAWNGEAVFYPNQVGDNEQSELEWGKISGC